jgi:iron complex outermembrane receptor protein
MRIKKIAVIVASLFVHTYSYAHDDILAPEVEVKEEGINPLPSATTSIKDAKELARIKLNTSDTAKLLEGEPGISLYQAGGVSSLPAIHGLADDRIRIKVDGMDLISACANHMNSPLSYIDPANVSNIKVYSGVTPVSVGGDSIGGTIKVESGPPTFATSPDELIHEGQIGTFYRSNNDARGANFSASLANDSFSARYTGSIVEANNYKAGGNFKAAGAAYTNGPWLSGDTVGSSAFKSENHALNFAFKRDNHLFDLKVGIQNIPYQGFPNQRMDMTRNDSEQINFKYTGEYGWGNLMANVYHENTRHSMNFEKDKQYWYGVSSNVAGMPMETRGKNTGASLKADVVLSERDLLKVGAEYQRYRLDDWWPPVANSSMMAGPDAFQNINNGQRDHYDVFAEWEAKWNQAWMTQLGLRHTTVKMDTDNVHGYTAAGMTDYGPAATIFNNKNHEKTDQNLDVTALVRFAPNNTSIYETGYSIKNRSPNLYERYTWANTNSMVMNMNNWVGDGNGYVGNLNLKPETAHTLSVMSEWHDANHEKWNLRVSPYYTYVQDYIDAVSLSSPTRSDGFVNLSLANQSARLYGADISGRMMLGSVEHMGSFKASGVISYVDGKNKTTNDDLYNIMPLNAKFALEQKLGGWTNVAEVKLVSEKDEVQAVRKELRTPGYGLFNLYSSYEWKQVRFDVGVENVFDKLYYHPLGGAYLGQGSTMSSGNINSSPSQPYTPQHGTAVPGMGRSINVGLTIQF